MGVPNLYRWLSERYPLINRPVNKLPMPEVDNFYLDANGILHTCTHGDNAEVKGGSEEEQLIDFKYTANGFAFIDMSSFLVNAP